MGVEERACSTPPDPERLGERQRRQWLMLTAQLCGTGKRWRLLPAALGPAGAPARPRPLQAAPKSKPPTAAQNPGGFGILRDDAHWIHREGVLWHEPSQTNLLFVTLTKSEALFCPSTRTRDLALVADGDSLAAGAGDTGGVDAGDGVGGLRTTRPASLLA